ncbi:MAG: polysaccharide deacetylase family protein [Armatimonadota bacterium]|jgi:peptidoglycan/xylan/chitin deacetylase (PgdA/CDA1 family)
MGQAQRVVAVFGFDMETDIGSWTPFYEGLVNGTPRILDLLSDMGIVATFYFTGHAAKAHPEVVAEVDSAGHEVGCHSLYHETVGDELFPIPGIHPLLAEEVPLRLKVATDHVTQALGREISSFRCPRLFGSTAVINALEALGYQTDASYPLYYYRERLTPYHPSRTDWTREGDSPILEIPNFADLAKDSQDPLGRDRDQWPKYRTEGAQSLLAAADSFIAVAHGRGLPAVLCFYLHPWEFVEMPSHPIHYGEGSVIPDPFIIAGCGDRALRELRSVIRGLQARGSEFSTAVELARAWV